ncbi:MAG TPA: hypothetical protein VIF57_11335 [Polyangia bacterium]|jgi:hypothetical protein
MSLRPENVVWILAMVLAVIALAFRAKRLAAKRGWSRVLPLIVLPLLAAVAITLVAHRQQLRRPAPPPAAAAVPPPPPAR